MTTIYRFWSDLNSRIRLDDRGLLDNNGKLIGYGRLAVTFPADACWFKACEESRKAGCLREIITVTAVCYTPDGIFSRSHSVRHAAQKAKEMFAHPLSDHLTEVNAFAAYLQTKRNGPLRLDLGQWCDKHFVNPKAAEDADTMLRLLTGWWSNMLGRGVEIISTPINHPEFDTRVRKSIAKALYH